MELPVFDLRNLKRYFYTFYASCLLISITAIGLYILQILHYVYLPFGRPKALPFFIIIGVLTFFYGRYRRKMLSVISETPVFEEKVRKYEKLFVKTLYWNGFSLFITGMYLVTARSQVMLYVLIFQLVFSLLAYPRKQIIAKELREEDILFI